MPSHRSATISLCALLVSACVHPFGPDAPSMNSALNLKPERQEARQTPAELRGAIWRELSIGNEMPKNQEVSPADYTAAGYNYVYRQCSNYFDSLILYQNKTHFTNDIVVAGGSGSGAILGLAKASSAAIGGLAAGVGFVTSAINSFDNRALITPYPNETKTLILSALDTYRGSYPPAGARTPAEAIVNVQHFAELCTYSGITRAAKQALSNYKGEVSAPVDAKALTLGAAISGKLGLASALDDAQLVALYWFINKGGSPCGKPLECAAVVAALPSIKSKIVDDTGAFIKPKDLKDLVGAEFDELYSSSADFKAHADAYPAQPPVTSKTSVDAKPAAKPSGGKLTTVATPIPLSERFNFSTTLKTKIPVAPPAEKFGVFNFSQQKAASPASAPAAEQPPKQ